MPSTKLWAVSTKGNVYVLSTDGCAWKQISTHGQRLRGFKKIAATPNGAWGLGCDHQVCVYVESSDLPIRCQVSTYENERWVITRGWSGNHLLPVDPYKWSNDEGDTHLCKDDFKLPSDNWKWESDWYVDENIHGFITDKGGWRYGTLDFHGNFSHQKTMKSCIRRRRWIRYKRFVSMDKWVRIPSIHLDPLEEPIVDIAIGGQNLPNQPQGFVSVWVTTVDGRVLHRTGVHHFCPEGVCWEEIPIDNVGTEVLSLSVGPTGLVWAVTWSGDILIRMGVDMQNAKGTAWVSLSPPGPDQPIVEAAVGTNGVWAVTSRNQVWFRKGVDATLATEEGAMGTGWLEMVSKMKMVGMGQENRVWGIDPENRQIHFRTCVTTEEPSGRRWQPILLSYEQSSHSASTPSLASMSSLHSTQSDTRVSDDQESGDHDDAVFDAASHTAEYQTPSSETAFQQNDMIKSVVSDRTLTPGSPSGEQKYFSANGQASVMISSTDSNATLSPGAERKTVTRDPEAGGDVDVVWDHKDESSMTFKSQGDEKVTDAIKKSAKQFTQMKTLSDAKALFTQVRGIGKQVKGEVNKQVKGIINNVVKDEDATDSLTTISFSKNSVSSMRLEFNRVSSEREGDGDDVNDDAAADNGLNSGMAIETESQWSDDDEEDYRYRSLPDLADIQWMWVSGMMVQVAEESTIRHWFSRQSTGDTNQAMKSMYHRSLSQGGWRALILKSLKQRNSQERDIFDYQPAIERLCWTKKGKMKWWRDLHRNQKWVDCDVELSQDTDTKEKNGSFSVTYKFSNQVKHMQIDLSDIACVSPVTDKSAVNISVFAIYLHSRYGENNKRLPPLRFGTAREEELEDWVSSLSVACCEHRGTVGAPALGTLWAATERGDIFVHEPTESLTELTSSMFWHQIGGHMEKIVTCKSGITWGIGHNKSAWVYTGGYGGGFFKGLATSPSGINTQTDERVMEVYENQRWRPVKGYTDRVFLSDCYMWSDVTGQEERSKDDTKLLSKHWTWVTDWLIDHKIPSGCDKEGWQYANSIKGPFTPRARFRSVLRRRRWIRKCQLVTSGPWMEVGPLPLVDVSIQPDHRDQGPVIFWAIGENGDVLARIGVTKGNPMGDTWQHVATEQPYTSICVGGGHRVWATAKDGSVWIRTGVTETNFTGKLWYHVPPPRNVKLSSVGVGSSQVWALDSNKTVWFRKGIADTCMEGKEWIKSVQPANQLSIGPRNQVWMITGGVKQIGGDAQGVVSRRVAVPDDNPKGGAWDHGIGGGWSWVCARAWYK